MMVEQKKHECQGDVCVISVLSYIRVAAPVGRSNLGMFSTISDQMSCMGQPIPVRTDRSPGSRPRVRHLAKEPHFARWLLLRPGWGSEHFGDHSYPGRRSAAAPLRFAPGSIVGPLRGEFWIPKNA